MNLTSVLSHSKSTEITLVTDQFNSAKIHSHFLRKSFGTLRTCFPSGEPGGNATSNRKVDIFREISELKAA